MCAPQRDEVTLAGELLYCGLTLTFLTNRLSVPLACLLATVFAQADGWHTIIDTGRDYLARSSEDFLYGVAFYAASADATYFTEFCRCPAALGGLQLAEYFPKRQLRWS